MNDFCSQKGIKREFSNARTPQQNGVAERRNRTLIEAARTMLANAKLPVTFWAEAVNTAGYVQNRVLVNKSQNKTPYELFNGRTPAIGYLKPFGCHVMILNTLYHLGKFEAKGDEEFLENKAIEKGVGPNWLFDIDSLTKSMNYVPVDTSTNSTNLSGTKEQQIKKVANQEETPSLDNILSLTNRFEDILGVESSPDEAIGVKADVNNMEQLAQLVLLLHSESVLKNKKDERGIVVRNKARLVAQGHTQEEGINYDEVFAPVARIEAIRLFLAYASFMGFTLYQMVAKSAFLYGTIDEEVGTIDQTLFIRRQRGDFILVQTIVAASTTEAEYVAAASCCGQVL
nr:hypothetical protein [Tanacetum cinerariifolium]